MTIDCTVRLFLFHSRVSLESFLATTVTIQPIVTFEPFTAFWMIFGLTVILGAGWLVPKMIIQSDCHFSNNWHTLLKLF